MKHPLLLTLLLTAALAVGYQRIVVLEEAYSEG